MFSEPTPKLTPKTTHVGMAAQRVTHSHIWTARSESLICSHSVVAFPYAGHPAAPPCHAEEIAETLAYALRWEGRKRVHHADDMMAWIVADRLVRHLERSGFVVMKRPAMADHSASIHS